MKILAILNIIIIVSCTSNNIQEVVVPVENSESVHLFNLEQYKGDTLIVQQDSVYIIKGELSEYEVEYSLMEFKSVLKVWEEFNEDTLKRKIQLLPKGKYYLSKEYFINDNNHFRIDSEIKSLSKVELSHFDYFFPLKFRTRVLLDSIEDKVWMFGTAEIGYQSRVIGYIEDHDGVVCYWGYRVVDESCIKEIVFNETIIKKNGFDKSNLRKRILDNYFSYIVPPPPPIPDSLIDF